MQNKLTGHWFRYSTKPNVPTLFTQSSQAKNLVFIFLLQPYSFMFKFQPQTSAHTHLSVIAPYNVTTSSTKIHR